MDHRSRRNQGLAYIADEAVILEMKQSRKILQELNNSDLYDFESHKKITKKLLGKSDNAFIHPPFYCDYGFNIEVGQNFYANFNCVILDVAKVTIGDNCFLAPNVSLYTASHPLHPSTRNTGYEYGKPITIGHNVWIGGSSVVCPGVTIGNNVVIGAGSVVTKNIPEWTIAAGNPCKVIRKINESDRFMLFKDEKIDAEVLKDLLEKMHDNPPEE